MKRPLFVARGAFGIEVLDALESRIEFDRYDSETDHIDVKAAVEGRPFVGVTLWRPHEALCQAIDEACFDLQIPWCVTMLDGHLLLSVVIIPGRGACYSCFRRRFLTHHVKAERQLYLYRLYDAEPSAGPQGYPYPAVVLAADVLWQAFGAPSEESSPLSAIDLLTLDASSSVVIPVHGCSRCGPNDPELRGPRRFTTRAMREVHKILAVCNDEK